MTHARNYHISVQYTEAGEEGLYCATVKEFPDITVYEETAHAAYDVALGLIGDLQELLASKGRPIPAPAAEENYSGRTTLRMSRSLHARISDAAERDDISLNQWIVEAIAWRLDGAKTPRTVVAPNAVSVTYHVNPMPVFDLSDKSFFDFGSTTILPLLAT